MTHDWWWSFIYLIAVISRTKIIQSGQNRSHLEVSYESWCNDASSFLAWQDPFSSAHQGEKTTMQHCTVLFLFLDMISHQPERLRNQIAILSQILVTILGKKVAVCVVAVRWQCVQHVPFNCASCDCMVLPKETLCDFRELIVNSDVGCLITYHLSLSLIERCCFWIMV